MVIGIVGTRRRDSIHTDFPKVKEALFAIFQDGSNGDTLVSGGCPSGGDRFAEILAKNEQIPIMIYYAKWSKYGKHAGFIRNGFIATLADKLIACVAPDRTGGTEDTIKKFLAKFKLTETEAIEKGVLILA